MYFVQKNLGNSLKVIFLSFRDFSRGFECVLVQMLLIQTLFSVLFYIRRKVILSQLLYGDLVILCAGQIDLELWSIL